MEAEQFGKQVLDRIERVRFDEVSMPGVAGVVGLSTVEYGTLYSRRLRRKGSLRADTN